MPYGRTIKENLAKMCYKLLKVEGELSSKQQWDPKTQGEFAPTFCFSHAWIRDWVESFENPPWLGRHSRGRWLPPQERHNIVPSS